MKQLLFIVDIEKGLGSDMKNKIKAFWHKCKTDLCISKIRGKKKLMSFMLKLGRNLRGLERVLENIQASFVMVIFHVCNVVGVFCLSEQQYKGEEP